MKRLTWSLALVLGVVLQGSGAAWAANTITVGSGSGAPGTQVEIPVTGQTDRDYASLTVRVTFPDAFCAAIESASVVRGSGSYALVEPQQDTLFCPDAGVILVSFFALNATAVPVGQGPLGVIRVQLAAGAAPGNYPLGAMVTQASGTDGKPYAGQFVVQAVGSITVSGGPTATATPTTSRPSATRTPTSTTTVRPTVTQTVEPSGCAGDCDGHGTVTVDELIKGVNIALGTAGIELCASFDTNGSNTVTVEELIKGVNNALSGCAQTGWTPTRTQTPARSATVTRTVPPLPPLLHVSTVSGPPGEELEFTVTLETKGWPAGTWVQALITFDPLRIPVAEDLDGSPDCVVNAALGLGSDPIVGWEPSGCVGTACNAVLAQLFSNHVLPVFPDGELYRCTVRIAVDAPAGTYPLTVSNVQIYDLDGLAILGASGTNGAVVVEAAPDGSLTVHPTTTPPF
jgi:hypothetical protein